MKMTYKMKRAISSQQIRDYKMKEVLKEFQRLLKSFRS